VRLHAATLPPALNVVLLPLAFVITEMGLKAALTALNAFTMPAPHSLPLLGQAHSPVLFPVEGSVAGTGAHRKAGGLRERRLRSI
jgi:hypothetical protein